jgi:hypothetical protein
MKRISYNLEKKHQHVVKYDGVSYINGSKEWIPIYLVQGTIVDAGGIRVTVMFLQDTLKNS